MRIILVMILFACAIAASGQSYSLSGEVIADDGNPMVYSTVVLLHPADSTLEFYGITNQQGHFDILNVKEGEYLMQTAFLGYQTKYRDIEIPYNGDGNVGAIVMNPSPVGINEVQVVGDYVPLAIKHDTIEYNAAAFKTKPDAVTEDLLRKLPGVEVDRAGNIKALGEDVRKLYVDGKEFFGNDPKVATKNVPADAIDKIQVYDKMSDEADFTGIDDGSRSKAINLKLKEDKKNALFGDVVAGGASGEHYQASGKVYRFNDKIQLAALGMANNVNQFGFSFNDYMNFNGGIANMMGGSGSAKIEIRNDGSFPVNFGQPVSGYSSSMVGGFNISRSETKNDRVFFSYLGSGTDKDLQENTTSWNYTGQAEYIDTRDMNENNKNETHRANFGWRNRIDTTQNLILNGDISLSAGKNNRSFLTKNTYNNNTISLLESNTINNSDRFNGNVNASYIRKINSNRTVFKISANSTFTKSISEIEFDNHTDYLQTGQSLFDSQFQDNRTDNLRYSVSALLTQQIGNNLYLEPEFRMGNTNEKLERRQGLATGNATINELSPDFEKKYQWIRPRLNFKYNTERIKFNLGLQVEKSKLTTTLQESDLEEKSHLYFTPRLSFENEYITGKRIGFRYYSAINTPAVSQLLPVVNNLNPMALFTGNRSLKPEYNHQLELNWWMFDQFSFSSFFARLTAGYTHDKINWARTVNDQFRLNNTLINVDNDFNARANIDYSTPIRKLEVNWKAETNT